MKAYETLGSWRPFLVEVGVEEIPSHYVRDIVMAFGSLIAEELGTLRIELEGIQSLATPRRLVVMGQVASQQTALAETVRGPLLANAYKDGAATPALLGFCRRLNISPGEIETMGEGDKTYVCARLDKPVEPVDGLLPQAIEHAFSKIPLGRSMRWGTQDYRFIRPVRWCSLWLGDRLLPMTVAGVQSSALTYGNRTDHPGPLEVRGIASYEQALAKGLVVLDPARREEAIASESADLAASAGGEVAHDEALMEEVVHLVEWPTPFLGRFDEAFLEVPAPVLTTSMKVHQRYFPVTDHTGHLMPYFIGVRNGIGRDMATVVHGNEKVLRARLSDALYFYRADRRRRLQDHVDALDRVVFHAKLGTYGDKIRRLHELFDKTASAWPLGASGREVFHRVLDLYKADLLTQVVQEFPELQGTMGSIYAEQEGMSQDIVQAIGEQYHPGYQGDRIPQTAMGRILVLLDRLDTVVLGIERGLKPTGSEDPFGMRRGALAIGRILEESRIWDQPPELLFMRAGEILGAGDTAVQEAFDLSRNRLGRYLESERHVSAQLSSPVLHAHCPWHTFDTRLALMERLRTDPSWEIVAQTYKRIDRVLGEVEISPELPAGGLPPERAVLDGVRRAEGARGPDEWWQALVALSDAVGQLFDAVLVNDPDPVVQAARRQILARARLCFNRYFHMNQD